MNQVWPKYFQHKHGGKMVWIQWKQGMSSNSGEKKQNFSVVVLGCKQVSVLQPLQI